LLSVEAVGDEVVLTINDESISLSRRAARELTHSVGDALTEREEFFRTACERREDGSYVIERRGADSTGNSSVFESFAEVRRLFDRLPREFGAEDVQAAGITGSRRHMLVRHFAEHPAFSCSLASRNPLRAKKEPTEAEFEQERAEAVCSGTGSPSANDNPGASDGPNSNGTVGGCAEAD